MSRRAYVVPTWLAPALLSAALVGCGGDGPTDPQPPPPNGTDPAISLDLAAGDLRILTDADEVRSFQLEGGEAPREYVVAVSSASLTASSNTPMEVLIRAADAADASISAPAGLDRGGWRASELSREERASLGESVLKRTIRRELRRVGARPAGDGRAGVPGVQFSRTAAQPPQVGDTLRFTLGFDDLEADAPCTDTASVIVSVAREVGERFVLAEDTAVATAFTNEAARESFYGELSAELDDRVYPTDSAYFGEPSDLDGNERVVVLFTKDVNDLSEPGGDTFVAGFFFSGDLADEETCPVGNQGELLYILAPDPDGVFGDTVSVTFAKRNARGVVSHEFQHLITAAQRVFDPGAFANLEETWLSEGFSHVAEEVSGLAVGNLPVRSNLTLAETADTNEAFETFVSFHFPNFLRLRAFFADPSDTQALATEDPNDLGSLRMRGFSWTLLRWAADRFVSASASVPPGSGEEAFFRELSTGGPQHLKGVDNLVRAVNMFADRDYTWEEILAEYASMPALDDQGPAVLPEATQVKTWDLRDVFLDLHNEETIRFTASNPFTQEYPLELTSVPLDASTSREASFDLRAGAQRYFLLTGTGGDAPNVVVEVRAPDGSLLPATAAVQVTVVRSQ